METALTFNEVTLVPLTHENRLWIKASELARALGYASDETVSRIYRRNADEFTDDMTQIIEIPAEGQNGLLANGRARIFSPRGCHLIAMFARSPVAKKFRKWVLDVLDKVCEPVSNCSALPDTISPEQQAQLHAVVDAKVGMLPRELQRKAYAEAWSRFCRHHRIAKYSQLPASKIGEAVDYLVSMELNAAKSLPPASSSEIPNNLPMLENAPEALRILHKTRELCRFKMIPHGFNANDKQAADRYKLHNDLYMAADSAWAFLWCLHGAMDKLERIM